MILLYDKIANNLRFLPFERPTEIDTECAARRRANLTRARASPRASPRAAIHVTGLGTSFVAATVHHNVRSMLVSSAGLAATDGRTHCTAFLERRVVC